MANENKREQILSAATTYMSTKGFAASKISQIAKKAGVADSVIYYHFKNKEDLLFSLTGRGLENLNHELTDHLQGVEDPVSSLKKIIWFHLVQSDRQPGFFRLLMFDVLRNPQFYRHPSYQKLRSYTRIIHMVIHKGVETEVFREDINIQIFRDLVLGLLDFEVLGKLAFEEVENAVDDLESIMDIILPMVLKKGAFQTNQPKNTAQRIMDIAEQLFIEKGYEKTTLLAVAKVAKVAEGTVYEYYKNKEELIFNITRERLQKNFTDIDAIFITTGAENKLKRLLIYYFESYMADRSFLKIFLLNVFFHNRFWESSSFDFFHGKPLLKILKEGQENGVFRQDVSSRIFRNICLGAVSHMMFRWIFIEANIHPHLENKSDKMNQISAVVETILRGIILTPDPMRERMP